MCKSVDPTQPGLRGQAYFRKDNWPGDQALVWDVTARKCRCGQWFVVRDNDPLAYRYAASIEQN